MSRLLLAGTALAVLASAFVAVALLAGARPETEAARAERLGAELRCPDCQALSVAESRTRAADAIRVEIARQVQAGRSDDQIRRHFVERYGEWILLAPADPVAWWLPIVAVAVAVAAFAAWLARARGLRRQPIEPGEGGIPRATEGHMREEPEALDG